MYLKWLGSALIVAGCAGTGFSMAASHRVECKTLRQLISALDYMACQLRYKQTPLPDLCRQVSSLSEGTVKKLFLTLGEELERQISPDAASCMSSTLTRIRYVSPVSLGILTELGRSLGIFDLEGQLSSLEAVRQRCREELARLTENQEVRLRSYQTLGVCAGAALAILLV